MDSSNSLENQIKKLKAKVQASSLPNDLFEKVDGMIASIGSGGSSNIESVSSYINWVTSLPFNSQTKDILDLNLAGKILDKNHYGLQSVKNIILEYLAALILNMRNKTEGNVSRTPILCLVGLVGTGKTTLAYSIAESLGRKFERIPFGGMGDAESIRGQSRVAPDAEPGLVIKSLVKTQSKNSVILLDELDRVTDDSRADIMGVLVELLDPQQNKKFTDHYIDYPFDLSNVLFIATANNTTNISTAVLDRLQIIQMPSYTDEEKTVIAKNYLFPQVRTQTGLNQTQITIDDAVWPAIIRPLGFDSGIRSLERSIEEVCRRVALLIVEGKASSVSITNDNIKEFLPS